MSLGLATVSLSLLERTGAAQTPGRLHAMHHGPAVSVAQRAARGVYSKRLMALQNAAREGNSQRWDSLLSHPPGLCHMHVDCSARSV